MFKFFQRLQWKLTLSYTLATVGTVLMLAVILIGLAVYTESQVNTPIFNSYYWSKTAFQDNIPYLLDDPQTLQNWLEQVQSRGFNWNDFQSDVASSSLSYANTLVTGSEPIFVLDPNLNLLAAAPLANPSAIGKPFNSRSAVGFGMESILEAAQTGSKNYASQSITRTDGTTLVAFPLRKTDDDPVVAIVIYTLKPTAIRGGNTLASYSSFFVIIALIMLVAALPFGAVFGWLASRGLRKRLGNLSVSAKAWSVGDFSAAPRDASGDEIGELTRNLSGMAEQLQTLIHTRDELARVEERNRLARDLHDTVKQQTYAARMQLSAAKNLLASNPESAAEHIESALQLNRETQQELKLIIDELRPAALEGKGLAQALAEYAARWQEHTGITVATSISGERSLPLDVEQVLYRVLQEALANVARHAEAETVGLSLGMSADKVTLIVADNGRGFELGAVSPNSLGLAGMKSRLAEVNGTLAVESILSVGTKVTAEVQLQTVDD